ncbi:hypothetical protein ACLD1F_00895 [Acinetobacter baumannii]
MDSKWIEAQHRELAKRINPELHCPVGFHNLRSLYELETAARNKTTIGYLNLQQNLYKPDPIIKLKEDLAKLVEKYKQDAPCINSLG